MAVSLLGGFGCATRPPVSPAQVASALSSPALCYVQYAGNQTDKTYAGHELAVRGFSCTPERIAEGKGDFERYQQIAAQRRAIDAQAEAARKQRAFEAGLQILTQPPPRPQQCQWQTNANGTGSMVCY